MGMGQCVEQQMGASSKMFTAVKSSYRDARGHQGGAARHELGEGDPRTVTTET